MRVFSYLFHLALALFMLSVGAVAWISGSQTLRIGVLPWQGGTLNYVLMISGAVGLIAVLLAFKRILPIAFLLWNVAVLVMLIRGYIFSPYRFDYGLTTPVYLMIGATIAAFGSWILVRRRPSRIGRASYERSTAM
jgi:hypothetical protein